MSQRDEGPVVRMVNDGIKEAYFQMKDIFVVNMTYFIALCRKTDEYFRDLILLPCDFIVHSKSIDVE